MLLPLLILPSVFFRVRPWPLLLLLSLLPSVKFRGNASACSSLRGYYFRDFLKLCYILVKRATPFS